MSGVDQQVRDWFSNMASVTRNLGAIKMAREFKAQGKQFTHRYIGSGVPSRTYGAQKILNIARGVYDTTDATDVQFHELIVMGDSILGLYSGLRFSMVLNTGGNTFITHFTRYNFNSVGVGSAGNTHGYNNVAILSLFNSRSKTAAYPIQIT